MIKNITRALLLIVSMLNSGVSYAKLGISVASGNGTNNSKVYRISVQQSWNKICFTTNKRAVNGYWEASFSRINAKKIYSYPTNHHVQNGSVSAAVRLISSGRTPLYIDLGLGIAYFTNQSIAARNLGSKWLFEDRAGVGVLFGKRRQFEFGYRFIHYSNAYMSAINNGLNLQLLVLGYWFK